MTPIIYLHGFASSPSSSKARFFRERWRELGAEIVVPDLAQGDFDHLTITGQLGVVEREAAGRAVSLIGSSMGGYLAALYAARHPEVARLVLMAPAFGFARRWQEYLGPEKVSQWQRTGTLNVFHYGDGREHPVHYALLQDARGYEDYPEITQPTLIFHGSGDDVVPCGCSREFAARHPGVQLEILDSDHELLNAIEHIWRRAAAFLAA